jgi:hypothetical protein
MEGLFLTVCCVFVSISLVTAKTVHQAKCLVQDVEGLIRKISYTVLYWGFPLSCTPAGLCKTTDVIILRITKLAVLQ